MTAISAEPVSPEPPLNVRLKGDKDKGRFCIHGVELIKWCKICDGAGTVGATPDWERMYRDLSASYAKICAAVGPMDEFDEVDTVVERIHELRASLPSPAPPDAERLAQRFHEAYERLAPKFDYKTRQASAVPWESVPIRNKQLMIAVCGEILQEQK